MEKKVRLVGCLKNDHPSPRLVSRNCRIEQPRMGKMLVVDIHLNYETGNPPRSAEDLCAARLPGSRSTVRVLGLAKLANFAKF